MEPPSKKPSSSSGTSQPRRERRRRERENRAEQPEAGPSTLPSKPPSETRRRRKRKNKENGDTATGEFDAVSGEFDGLDSEKNDADNAGFEIGEDFVPFVDSEPPTPPPTEHADTARRKDRDRDTRRDDAPTREWDKGKGRTRDWEWDSRNDSGSKRKHDTMIDMDEVYANNRKQREQAQSRRAPWLDNIDWDSCNNVAEMLHREVESFVNYISPSPIEDEVRGLVVKLVSRAVTQAFPDAQVLPFGSYETKLYLPLGDIDLVIHSDSMAYSDKVIVLRALAGALKRAGITSNVTIIAKAKVPIIKFVTTHGRFNVDVSVNQGNGVVAGQIVNGFLKEMDGGGMALRSLVMVTKAFLSQRSMNEVYSGGLGSYSIVCLAVSFLQMHPKIRRGEIDAEKNLGVLVMEFFELYGCYFNYEEVGISVRDGGTYYSKKQRGWLDYYKRHLLSIEDPTDPSNDISKGSYGFNKVRATFAGAHGIMTTAAYLRASLISSRREGRSSSFRETYAPEDLSILSSVMGVTQEVRVATTQMKEDIDTTAVDD
ncbi:hypothetical protein PLICRDRAFT_111020 [Plicaturopsis crispa FD-325 SS-3]|nr:hypothetical protein PLICRDRAFT_111020 [Plicaturopsis crispa FD-325 SS-3]